MPSWSARRPRHPRHPVPGPGQPQRRHLASSPPNAATQAVQNVISSSNKLLTARGAYRERPLVRAIFDRTLRTPPGARVLFVSGQVGLDSKGKLGAGIEKQCDLAWKNIGQVLKAAGMDFGNVVTCHVQLADMGEFKEMNDVYATYFGPTHFPARTTLEFPGLPGGARIEVSCIAYADKARLLAESDVVSIHLKFSERSRGLIGAGDGLFTQTPVRHGEITDGLSNTVAFSESTLGNGQAPTSAATADPRFAVFEVPGGNDPTTTDCDAAAAGTWNARRGGKWLDGHYGNTLYNHYYTPNPAGKWDCGNASHNKGLSAARSYHSGGVNVVLGDGSVRFVSNSVTIGAWRALSTRSAGDIVAGTF